MLPVFPDYADILLDGFSDESDYGVLRTEMDGGIAKQRARWTKAIVTRDAKVLVRSVAEKASFDEWMRDELRGGAGWFEFYDPLTQITRKTRIVNGKIKWTSPGFVWEGQCQMEMIG